MSANQPDPADEEIEARSWRDMIPFIIAAVLVVLVLGAIGLSHLLRPSEERVSDDTLVQYVVNDMYSARNSLNYELYRSSQCEKNLTSKDFPTSAEFAETNRTEREKQGKITIPTMDVDVAGDRAAVVVHEKRESADAETITRLTVIKTGDEWKVCAA